jgi:hypothetical protein
MDFLELLLGIGNDLQRHCLTTITDFEALHVTDDQAIFDCERAHSRSKAQDLALLHQVGLESAQQGDVQRAVEESGLGDRVSIEVCGAGDADRECPGSRNCAAGLVQRAKYVERGSRSWTIPQI